jgi:hypothetical protein
MMPAAIPLAAAFFCGPVCICVRAAACAQLKHVRDFSSQLTRWPQVLAVLPSAMRHRVLGYMYSGVLADSWLLEG